MHAPFWALVSQNVEFLVSEQGNIRGPMRLEAVRREIGGGTLEAHHKNLSRELARDPGALRS